MTSQPPSGTLYVALLLAAAAAVMSARHRAASDAAAKAQWLLSAATAPEIVALAGAVGSDRGSGLSR